MIYILWATIRPTVFMQMHKVWLDRAVNKDNIITKVSVNFEKDKEILKDYNPVVAQTTKIGVCYPSYVLSSNLVCENDTDIIVYASDDFIPPQNWDEYLINKLKDKSGCLMVRDGYQLPDSSNMQYPCVTIPIMTYDCLKKLNGIIYNPVYTHMYSDCELYINVKELGLLIDDRLDDTTLFEHLHYAAGKRNSDVMDQQYHVRWKEDEATWNKRRLMKVEDRL